MSKKKIKRNLFNEVFPSSYDLDNVEIEEEAKKENTKRVRKERRGRPRKKNIIREKGPQQGLPADETRKTYLMKVETVEKVEAYADKTDQTIKDALNELLEEALTDKGI